MSSNRKDENIKDASSQLGMCENAWKRIVTNVTSRHYSGWRRFWSMIVSVLKDNKGTYERGSNDAIYINTASGGDIIPK